MAPDRAEIGQRPGLPQTRTYLGLPLPVVVLPLAALGHPSPFFLLAMPAALCSDTDWAALVAAERARREQAEAALAVAQAQAATLEGRLAAAAVGAQRYYTQLTALVQHLPAGLVLVDHQGHIQFVNQQFWDLFGLPPVVGPLAGGPPIPHAAVSISNAFADPAAFAARANALNAAGQTVLHEEFRLADGRVVELDYLVLDTVCAGRLICYRDVTERHQRDAEIRKLSYLPQQNPNPTLRLTATGDVLYANPAAQPLLQALAANPPGHAQRPLHALVQAALRTPAQQQQTLDVAGQYYLCTAVAVPGEDYVNLYLTNITARQQAEQEIVRQQEFYESVLNLLPVDVAVFDASHRYLFVNPSAVSDPAVRRQIIGLTNDDYFALRHQQHPTGLHQQRNQYFDLAVRTGRDVTWEEMRTGHNQRPQLMLRHLRPVFGADGALRLVVGSGIDITARYQAEKLQHEVQAMLQEQQDFIRQILDALPNVVYVVEPAGDVSFSNQAYTAIMAHSRHWQEVGASAAVREEMHQMQQLNELVRATQQVHSRELPFTLASGETLYVQVHKRPMLRADGQVAILTVSTDVTAVKQARQELERREKQYHDLVYYSQALICTHDLDGKLLSVNPAIEQLMGVPAAQLVGRNIAQAMLPKNDAALQAYLDGDEAAQPQPRVVIIHNRAGERRYLNYYTYKVTEEGHPPYVVASGYDVTPGVLAQRALQQAKQDAEENAQAKENFLAHMSHEIRTPLNGVLGLAGLLQKTALTAVQQEYLTTMQVAGRHLLTLVNDVLDMAKITTRHLEFEHLPFDPRLVLEGVGQTMAALAVQHGLELVVRPPTAGYRLVGDAYRLRQVLLNLLSNALKFTERGRVEIGAEVLDEALAAAPGAVVLHFWVADTGIGMSPAEQAHIFEAFAQANTDTSRRYGGTGLGLAISQQLVEQMGGLLQVRSLPGAGTTFSFALLLRRDETLPEAAADRLPAATYEALRGLRVLLAEDNLVNQQIAKSVLEHWGVQVQAVSNGLDALAQLRTNAFDAALLDIRMPGLSGVEVTTAIRMHPDFGRAAIPIAALTANAFENDRIAYLAAGMNACLTKPYEEAALCQLLLSLTKLAASERE